MKAKKATKPKTTMHFRQSLFWDVNPKNINAKKHARYIIERILDFGNDREAQWLFKRYRKNTIKKVVDNSRVLHPQSRTLWRELLTLK